MTKPVAHYSEGRNSWNLGFQGALLRLKSIVVLSLVTLFTMGLPWWWPANLPSAITISFRYSFLFVVIVIGASVILALLHLRKLTKKSLDRKYYLHTLAHNVRECQTALFRKLAPSKTYSQSKLTKSLEEMLTQICEDLSAYFRSLVNDDGVAVSIRLAVPGSKPDSIVYKTFARSSGLNPNRKSGSESIPSNEGIPRFLREDKSSRGVLFYYDLKLASDIGAYKITQNDKNYSDDVATMMVAPLNAWTGKTQDMIGLLYVTSRHKDVFNVGHVDSVGFAADHTATAIANVMELVKLKRNVSNPNGSAIHA